MKRTLILSVAAAMFSGLLTAGDFKKSVEELGDKNQQPSALAKLGEAGGDAFDDLLDGLKLDLEAEKDPVKQAQKSAIRLACARLLGTLRDTRATPELLRLLRDEKTRQSYVELSGAVVMALGKIAAAKPDAAGSADAVAEIKKLTADEKSATKLRYSGLNALAELKQGGEIAQPLLKDGTDALLRSAAVTVIGSAKFKAAADDLFAVWDKQRKGESKDYSQALGVQALFALANFGDERSIQGLIDVSTLIEFDFEASYREMARGFLKELSAKAIPILIDIIKDDTRVAQHNSAARLLGEFGVNGVRALVDVAKLDKENETKYANRVESLLFQLVAEHAITALIDTYRAMAPDDPGRKRVLTKILAQRPKDAISLFKEVAADAKVGEIERAMAVDAYAEAAGKDSFEDLKAWSSDIAAPVRRAATRNLGREFIPLTKSEEVLKGKLADEDSETRQVALTGLQRSDKKELLPLFTKLLKEDKAESVRRAAVAALEQFNISAKLEGEGVYEPVKAAFNEDKDATVRASALRFAITLAEQRGDNSATKEMVHKAIIDADLAVRSQAYTQMFGGKVKEQIDLQKLIDAALKETDAQGKADAVQALSYIDHDKWGGKLEKLDAVADLGLAVLAAQRSAFAPTLLSRLSEKGGQFTRISDKARALLDEALKSSNPDFQKVASYLEVLTGIKEKTGAAFDLARKAAKLPSVEARRAAVSYIQANGDKNDAPFLRELANLGDATAGNVRKEIEEAIRQLEAK